jgi:flagellar biogenesis protein FliO
MDAIWMLCGCSVDALWTCSMVRTRIRATSSNVSTTFECVLALVLVLVLVLALVLMLVKIDNRGATRTEGVTRMSRKV